jgi:arabinogalactan endo-1,4-beta-galactosidase
MQSVIARYQKPVMIAEVGMPWTDSVACKLFLTDLIAKTKAIPNKQGLGVFYWEPEAHNQWKGYTLGAFNNSGCPTTALLAFKP